MTLPEHLIKEIQQLAEAHGIERVVLFGSRARGDAQRTSDIDLAAYGGDVKTFGLDLEEETSTLLFFDCVDMSQPIRAELREAIEKEGITLYDKAGANKTIRRKGSR